MRDEIAEALGARDPRRVHQGRKPDVPGQLGEAGGARPRSFEPGKVDPARQRGDERVPHVVAVRVRARDEVALGETRRASAEPVDNARAADP